MNDCSAEKHDKAIELDHEYIMSTYGRYPLVPKEGKNAVIIDENGKKYIDFTSGIGVSSLGISDEGWISAVTAQISKISHISNYFYSETSSALAEKIIMASGLKKVFFGNSGAEANEGAIKVARKYSFDKYGEGRAAIITMNSSFHGRTITTLAATGQDSFHKYFSPFTEGFVYSPLNDIAALDAALTPEVCAIMAEPIQGEGGVNLMSDEFAAHLRKVCDERDILLIFDEVQCGTARTGKMYAFQTFEPECKPDIMTLAKGLGGGLPIGAFVCAEKCSDVLGAGMHGTTFGSNPVVCAGGCEVMDRVMKPDFLSAVEEKGEYIRAKLTAMNCPCVKQIRGKGLMIGIEAEGDPHIYSNAAFERGLLILTAGKNVVRLLPALTITYSEIDEGLAILESVLKQ
ncbi:MAG: aspartate aminotransferase family protein [Eubacteriales bacterium]